MKNDAFLTIDSGGSKTNLSLYSSEGTLIKKSTCQGFGKTFDTNEIIPELLSVIQRHCDGYTVDTIVCNLGGRNKGEILKTLKTFSPSSEVLVLRESEGDIGRMLCKMYNAQVALLAGTGSIAIADVEDNTVICGGWGANIGDMGSGYQLGLEAIQQVLKEIDCSEHFSLLSKTILKEECPPRLISASEYCKYRDSIREKLSPFDRYHIAEYAKVVYKCAEEGDDTSLSLYKKVGEDLADIVLSAIAKIGENSVGVVVSGGMVNAKQFWENHFENRLSTHTDLKNISYIANGIDQALSEIAKRVIER